MAVKECSVYFLLDERFVGTWSFGRCHKLWLDGRGSIPAKGKRLFSFLQFPDRLWGLRSLLSNGY
jgi:hypothetical protein